MSGPWVVGESLNRRERLGLVPREVVEPQPASGVWMEMDVLVVEDTDEHLVTYAPTGAPMRFPTGPWPSEGGVHPWSYRGGWSGHGCLMVHEPAEHHAVWHFWDGPNRDFTCWYINLQTAFVRTEVGYDTQDLELDIVVAPDMTVTVKDDDVLDARVDEGRYSAELVHWVRDYGESLTDRLRTDGPWWDLAWAEWTPPAGWDRAGV